ncbi:putative dehydrogenase [Orbus hercynius]|uniref:Putative dehydrogenase n=1 Tax=Orbus hercynius TaxID=593135 RepID=A0A495RHT7_9GAMM|nr:Gfo/Idh/MocA family oxidoreductase [Orbus hercynius]RKS86981.1 putative dehydrogenase [Orbus hercynius]
MINLAVIGSNWISDKFIAAALQTGEYKLVAVYSRHYQTATEFASKYAVDTVFTDLAALASSAKVEAVYIASPNSLHFEQAKLMLENGKHVICEKPLASNAEQVNALIAIAKRHHRVIFEALKIFYLPNYDVVKQFLPKLGKIRKVFLSYCQYSSRYARYLNGENPNTFNPQFSNGSIMDIGVYPLNFAVGLWGKPNHINAQASLLASGVDAHGTVLMNYGEFDVVICHSKVSDSHIPSEIQGEEGALIIEHLSVGEKVMYKPRQGEWQDITLPQHDNTMYYEAKQFAVLCQHVAVDHSGLHLSLTTAELLTEIRRQTGIVFPADKV